MINFDANKINWNKVNGLIPCVVQDQSTLEVLMLGYMNEAALAESLVCGKLTFFSRSRQRLWTKGETSGNYLHINRIMLDCDADTLLVMVTPNGPVCHTGAQNCFGNEPVFTLQALQNIIGQRLAEGDASSYSVRLHQKGIRKIAQKVGEEAVEVVLEAEWGNDTDLKNESADLLYHLLLLLRARQISLAEIEAILQQRHQAVQNTTLS